MDYDNDGTLDFISGSYDPGDLYLFRGEGDGKYAAVEKILDKSGLALVHHPQEFREWSELPKRKQQSNDRDAIGLRVASFGSWPAMVDWDDDGDLDILIGSFAGDLFLRINEGTREQPVYTTEAEQVEAAGEPLHVNMHAAPAVADWDNDGKWDLVVGSGDGAVGWFRNTGSPSEPKFGSYSELVAAASDDKFLEQTLAEGEAPKLGARAQICVTDYNHDGRLDLILGDYSEINWLRELSDLEKKKQAALQAEMKKLAEEAVPMREKMAENYDDPELQQAMAEFSEKYMKLRDRSKRFFADSRSASSVWLFLRQSGANASGAEVAGVTTDAPEKSSQRTEEVDGPVSIVAGSEPVEQQPGVYRVTVEITIQPGWHLYAEVPNNGSVHRATKVALKLPEGVQLLGKWKRPPGMLSFDNPREKVYRGFVKLTQRVRLDTKDPVTIPVIVEYEVCNKDFCLPVEKVERVVELKPPS